MSTLSNSNLAAIDEALSQLEPTIEQFGHSHNFVLVRSHVGSFNVPRRWLQRCAEAIFQEIGLVIALPMPERLARGFFPEIPCTLYINAAYEKVSMHYSATIFEALPFSQIRNSLGQHLAVACAKLDACSPEFVVQNGRSNSLA